MARPTLFTHPKFRRLCHDLDLPEPHALGHLEFLWHAAYESGDARIGDAVDVELAAKWGGERGVFAAALLRLRFLDEIDGALHVHDLHDHEPQYVKDRRRKEAERRARGVVSREQSRHSEGRPGASSGNFPDTSGNFSERSGTPAPAPAPEIQNPPSPLSRGVSCPPNINGGDERKHLEAAERVAARYREAVQAAHVGGDPVPVIADLLRSGVREEGLIAAAERYADHARRNGVETRSRPTARRFFGSSKGYESFMTAPVPLPEKRRATPRRTLSPEDRAASAAALRGVGRAPNTTASREESHEQ